MEKLISELVIKALKRIAKKQGISTLKLMGRHNLRITPTTWTPGVTCKNESYSDKQDKEYTNVRNKDDIKYNDIIEQEEINDLFADN